MGGGVVCIAPRRSVFSEVGIWPWVNIASKASTRRSGSLLKLTYGDRSTYPSGDENVELHNPPVSVLVAAIHTR